MAVISTSNNDGASQQVVIRRWCDFTVTGNTQSASLTTIPVSVDYLRFWHCTPRWWGKHAARSMVTDNAGGKSQISEAVSIEYFTRMFGASAVKLEMEVAYYFRGCSMVDFVAKVGRRWFGVSVTRAMQYLDNVFDEFSADRLLRKKLYGLVVATTAGKGYSRSVLHVFCQNQRIAALCAGAAPAILAEYEIADTVTVILTVCEEDILYSEQEGDAGDMIRDSKPFCMQLGG